MSTTSRLKPLKPLKALTTFRTFTAATGALAAAGLAAGAFSAFSRMHYRRSASATLVEYGTLPVKKLTSRVPITERIAWMANRPEPRRAVAFPAWGRLFYDLERNEDDGMPVYTLRPHSPSDTIIVYLHGGGYVSTAVLPHSLLVDTLAHKTGADVVMPLYPLAPHHTWQEAHQLVLNLYLRILSENPDKRIILMGDSSGGGLAAVIALSLAERGIRQPDELILLSPWVDVTHTNPDIADYVDVDPLMAPDPLTVIGQTWAGETPTTDWHLSPIYGDLSALERVTTFVGSREIFLPDNSLFHAELIKAGTHSTLHIGENLNHVYPMSPTPEGRRAREEIIRIITGSPAVENRQPDQTDQTGTARTPAVTE